MDLNAVMEAVASRVDTIAGLRCFAYPAPDISPPAALVDYPETIDYDETYGRGMDRMSLPLWVLAGRPTDRSTAATLAAYAKGSGASSVKAVLESGAYTAFDEVRVVSVAFEAVDVGGVVYMGARFELDIAGQGSS